MKWKYEEKKKCPTIEMDRLISSILRKYKFNNSSYRKWIWKKYPFLTVFILLEMKVKKKIQPILNNLIKKKSRKITVRFFWFKIIINDIIRFIFLFCWSVKRHARAKNSFFFYTIYFRFLESILSMANILIQLSDFFSLFLTILTVNVHI